MIKRFAHLYSHSGFQRYFYNSVWLLLERLISLIVGLFVGIWVARYLGPDRFGILSYVIAFTTLFAPLGKLGLDGIISRNVAREDADIDELLSTSLVFKFGSSCIIAIAVPTFMFFFHEQIAYFYIAVALSVVYLVKASEVLEFYFRAKVQGKYIAIANCIGILLTGGLKVVFILAGMSLAYFAFANLFGALITSIVLVVFFSYRRSPFSLMKITFKKGLELLKESWPLIFGGFFAVVYLNIDQVMIQHMMDSSEVGQYSAAVRLSSLWYVLPMTIAWSIQTALVNAKKNNTNFYYKRLQMLFSIMALCAYIIILPISYFSEQLTNILFGSHYFAAGEVVAIHIWASLFVFVGVIRGLWVTNESYFKFSLFSNLAAGFINIALNYLWLPLYGINGAAWATLISYGFTYVASGFFFAPARKVAWMQVKSILFIDIFTQLISLKGLAYNGK